MNALTADARAAVRAARDEARRTALGLDDLAPGSRRVLLGGVLSDRRSAAVIGLATGGDVPEVALLHAVVVFAERARLKPDTRPGILETRAADNRRAR